MDPAGELTTLTREEKAYLNNKKQISLCVRTDTRRLNSWTVTGNTEALWQIFISW